MKTNLYVEYCATKVCDKNLYESAKEIWKSEGRLMKDLFQIDLYYKPEENKCYYVFNSEKSGFFCI